MQEKGKRIVPLKNGGNIEPALGVALLELLENLLEQEPAMFHALLAVAQGRADDIPPNMMANLKQGLLLRSDGSISADVRDVLLSGYQPGPEPILVNPFRLESADQVRDLERVRDQNYQRLARLLRREDEKKGRPR